MSISINADQVLMLFDREVDKPQVIRIVLAPRSAAFDGNRKLERLGRRAKERSMAEAAIGEGPVFISVRQAARILGMGATACYAAIQRGDIPVAVRINGRIRIPRVALIAWANTTWQDTATVPHTEAT